MNRVTFGVASSPFLAVQTLQQASLDFGQDCPVAQQHLTQSFYVDDLLGGSDSVEGAVDLYTQLTSILDKAGFTLRKFRSSSAEVLSHIPENLIEPLPNKAVTDCHTVSYPKALGVIWNSKQDAMSTDVIQPGTSTPTKRGILSNVSKTFDVLGWITPAIFPMKLLLKQLWKSKKGWDDPIDEEAELRHKEWREELSQLSDISLPRCYFSEEKTVSVSLQGFCDASEQGFAAVVYIRATYETRPPTCRIVVAKSRLAPKNTRTIPELELCGAVLLTSLLETTSATLGVPRERVEAWSDSTIVLGWLTKCPSDYKTFVANRITTVITSFPSSHWHHVPTTENPADCASRGISAKELREHPLWWSGPPWLLADPIDMPRQPQKRELDACQEEGARPATCLAITAAPAIWLAGRYSSLQQLIHVTAYVKRAANNLLSFIRPHTKIKDAQLSVEEIRGATNLLLQFSQKRTYSEELSGLRKSPPQPIKRSSHLLCLNPFLGSDGLLHVGGRLSKASISYSQKHPILLSPKDPLTRLIFLSQHLTLGHCGPTMLFSTIGSNYYVTAARRLAKTICRQCVVCQKIAATTEQQLMGQLPAPRVTESQSFIIIGVDYAGPFTLKTDRKRKAPEYSAWLAVFVCFATKGVHLEVIDSATTESFLATLRNLICRRGAPSDIYSDNGPNFKGAKNDLNEFYKWLESSETTEALRNFLLSHKITWHNIPERAPHFGGLWEAAVKSAKFHLKRIMGKQVLTYKEFNSVAIQIEACLNSRPLMHQYCHSPDGVEPLTAAHLLIGRRIMAYPETEVDLAVTQTERWTLCQQIVQAFWKRWSKECLNQLQAQYKWRNKRPNLAVGDVVLIRDKTYFQTHWGLARVVKLYPGEDGLVRSVDVKVCTVKKPDQSKPRIPLDKLKSRTSIFRRPIFKLSLLISAGRDLPSGGGCLSPSPPQTEDQ